MAEMALVASETHDQNWAKKFVSQKRFNQARKKYRPPKNALTKHVKISAS
jgi:hypothetical protein